MGEPVIIYGKSGSGKSRSLKNFASDEITLINVERKSLPFRKRFKYTVVSDSYPKIIKALNKMPTKTAVIDDAGYLLTNTFMRGHSKRGAGSNTFDLYNDIGDRFWELFQEVKNLPEDVIVYIIMHEEESNNGHYKLKTLGKMLENIVCVEGMSTIAIRCMCRDSKHFFRTKTEGDDITKTPEDMFSETEIENDLKAVDTAIRKYFFEYEEDNQQ